MSLRFNDTGAGDEKKLAAAHRNLVGGFADVKWIGHVCYLTIVASGWDVPRKRVA
jgi:hypothetical protein